MMYTLALTKQVRFGPEIELRSYRRTPSGSTVVYYIEIASETGQTSLYVGQNGWSPNVSQLVTHCAG